MTKTIAMSLTALALGGGAASAAVVCNDEGDCWRIKGRAVYKPELRLRVYDDDWKWGEDEHSRWREAGHGHGYWHRGVWVDID